MAATSAWIGLALVAAIAAAGVAIFGKLAVADSGAVSVTVARSLIMSAVLVAFAVLRGEAVIPAGLASRTWLWIALAGVSGAASWLAYFAALRLGPATAVALIDRGSIVFVFLLAYLVLNERPTPRAWLGLLLVMIGMVVTLTAPIRPATG